MPEQYRTSGALAQNSIPFHSKTGQSDKGCGKLGTDTAHVVIRWGNGTRAALQKKRMIAVSPSHGRWCVGASLMMAGLIPLAMAFSWSVVS